MYRPILLTLVSLLTTSSSAIAQTGQSPVNVKLQKQEPVAEAPPVAPPVAESLRVKRATTGDAHKTPHVDMTNATPLERGKFFSLHGEYREAMDFFTRASSADPKNPEPYNRRARAEWQLEQLDNALEDARYAIKLNPDYAEAFCTRAAILNSMGHFQEAIADAALAEELKPNLRDAYTIQAAAYRNLTQYRNAETAVGKLNSVANPQSAFDEWTPDVDFNPYFFYLQKTVKQHWQPPQGDYGPILVLFKVHRNGQITDARINNSGNASADEAALQAAKASAPFLQPPAGAPPDFDVFIVLDPPAPGDPSVPQAAQQAAPQTPVPASKPGLGIKASSITKWSGTLYQGLNIMRMVIPR